MFERYTEFEWDEGNSCKSLHKHDVADEECEEVFFNEPLIVASDIKHSQQEQRFAALGETNFGRKLFLVFTLRENKIRVISARDMNKKERVIYERNS